MRRKTCQGCPLAEWLAEKCEYTNGSVYDLARVAEYFLYKKNGDREQLENSLRELLTVSCTPRPIHTVLAQLNNIKIVITSNYDTLLEAELAKYGRSLVRNIYNPNNSRAGHFPPIVDFAEKDIILHKMHGSIEERGSLVITQSDYIRYLANLYNLDRGMPEYFHKTMIPIRTLLFLGYSLEDWNFRVIWEGVLSSHQPQGPHKISYALVRQPSDFQKIFWIKRNVQVLDGDLTELAIKLAKRFNLEIPQLDINKESDATAHVIAPKKRDPNRPITILFLSANPADTDKLRLAQEARAIDKALQESKFRDKIHLEQLHAAQVGDLQSCLLRYEPDIVHFSGHGMVDSIILEDEEGNSQPVTKEALGGLFRQFKDTVRCVVLNACFSQLQAEAIAEHVEAVIGTALGIGDEAARHFASGFYEALGYGRNLQAAFDLGCSRIQLAGLSEHDTPRLLVLHNKAEEIVLVQSQA